MTKQFKADLMLLLVALFWGGSYLLMDISLTEVETFNLNALRFISAFLIALVVTFKKIKNVNKITIKYAAFIGFILMFVYIGATYGVQYTSLSNTGFLCSLTVVITPILGFFFKGQKPEKKLIIVVIMALIGIALLTLNDQLRPALGDILCIMCAFAYAIHLLVIETAVQKEGVNAFQLGVFQLGFAGLYQLIISFLIETPRFPTTPKVWISVIVLSIFCTGLAFIIQTVAQQYTSASHVGVIFTSEPVFAGLVAFFIAGEVLSVRAYIGAVILLCSILIMELDIRKITGKIRR
ncbi:MAG: DMT family transporter [Eubacteriales bacterium]|nr:DMT family transporter [Eubacteriales bacterium]MDD4583268.1 DMT family transporter [Eubacteriales bacterium]